MAKKAKTGPNDIYEKANRRIIELLEKGEVAWRRTWGAGLGFAKNFKTNHVYTGVNFLFMNFLAEHPIPYYLTFKQAKAMGGKIKKGAKAEWVYYYNSYYKDEDGKNYSETEMNKPENKDREVDTIRFLKSYPVFNIEDTEGIEWERPEEINRPNDPIQEGEIILQEMQNPPKFEQLDIDKACYYPTLDTVNMPPLSRFENSVLYYRTLFHEVAHSTGHPKRLGRRKSVDEERKFGSPEYALEELIAELTSNYLMNITGIQNEDAMNVSAGYLKSWIERLEEHPRIIFKAAPKAYQAVEYILGTEVSKLPMAKAQKVTM